MMSFEHSKGAAVRLMYVLCSQTSPESRRTWVPHRRCLSEREMFSRTLARSTDLCLLSRVRQRLENFHPRVFSRRDLHLREHTRSVCSVLRNLSCTANKAPKRALNK